jgi:hypothetical protein
MSRTRTSAVGAVVAAALAASTVAVTTESGAAAPQEHVTRVVLDRIAFETLGRTFVGANAVRKDGRVVGYESFSGRFNPRRGHTVHRVALALKGGVIEGRVIGLSNQTGEKFFYRGPIQSGNGRFAGISGRIVEVESATGPRRMRLRWHIEQ